jgi:tetratricopeptide (TPR) repeat protein
MALAMNPEYAEAHFNLGNAYADSGQMDNAIEQYESAVRLHPGNAYFRNMLGITYGQEGMYEKAVEQFEAAVRLSPSEPAYRRNLDRASGMRKSAGEAQRSPGARDGR